MSDTPTYDALCRETGLDPARTGVLFRDRVERFTRATETALQQFHDRFSQMLPVVWGDPKPRTKADCALVPISRAPRRHTNRCKVCGRFTSARELYDRFDCALRAERGWTQ